MAQQDDIIIIKTVENITTSILDYFLNVALVTTIGEGDLLPTKSFSASGKEEYDSYEAVAEKFATTSAVYKIARDVFAQKNNSGINQSNIRRLVVIKKEDGDASFEACLNRVNYKNSFFVIVNPTNDEDILSAYAWTSQYRKLLFVQTNDDDVKADGNEDIASQLVAKNASRCAIYYHKNADESLAGAMASILASYPIGGKGASYRKPTGITVDNLSPTEEANLANKNTNYYVAFIGGAGDYSTRYLTSDNGVTCSGDEIQKIIAVDRTVLSLQAGLMDALEQDVPYDDNGGTIVYNKVNGVFSSLKRENIFAQDSVDEETGEMDYSYTIHVLPRATVKKNYPDYFKQKMFIVETTVNFAGAGKKVSLTLAY